MEQWINEMVALFMPYGVLSLLVVSFLEASVFPIPPDVFFIPMILANPYLGLYYALIVTGGSVLGSLFGYLLGYRLGRPFLIRVVKAETLRKVEKVYQKYGDWATAVGGVTPLPYKLFVISAGVFRNRLATFILASVSARGIRFFGEAVLLMLYGKKILKGLEVLFGPLSLLILFGVLLLIVAIGKMGWIPRQLTQLRQKLSERWLRWAAGLRPLVISRPLLKCFYLLGIILTIFGVYFFLDAVMVLHK